MLRHCCTWHTECQATVSPASISSVTICTCTRLHLGTGKTQNVPRMRQFKSIQKGNNLPSASTVRNVSLAPAFQTSSWTPRSPISISLCLLAAVLSSLFLSALSLPHSNISPSPIPPRVSLFHPPHWVFDSCLQAAFGVLQTMRKLGCKPA